MRRMRMKIAIVGSGISGLVAAYSLAERHEVTLFEAGPRLGGHTNTIELDLGGRHYALDTGFLVYNERTYPNFTRLLKQLSVATQPSEMSFSVRSERSRWEYCGSSLSGLFAQRSNFVRPGFYRMLADIMRFNRTSLELLDDSNTAEDLTLGEYVARGRFGRAFLENYLIPMGAAIWSAPPSEMYRFPARYFVRFFANHGLLSLRDRPQWRTVTGGATRYIAAMRAARPFEVRLQSPVRQVRRDAQGVSLDAGDASSERFEQVVIAAHADQALGMLADATTEEREILGAFTYQRNEATLHTDTSLLPSRRRAWASWNYHVPVYTDGVATVTYWLNRLQNIQAPHDFCVTLNDAGSVHPTKILRRITYHHPLYTSQSVAAQHRWHEISGQRRTHYCGAYWGYGFHEDGVRSGLAVAGQIDTGNDACTAASTKAESVIAASAP